MNLQIRRASMALLLSVFCFVAYAQKTVTGTVKDAAGEPMIGVSIIVDGTTIGGVTDFDGNFSIKDVPENGVLKISYIGYKDQKIAVADKSSFNVTMLEDAASLDEIVVVGYGTMKKKDLTGSVASVKTDDLAKVAGANALSAMQAKIPGMDLQLSGGGEAGAGVSMTLRGNRSLLAGNGPLVIVDGVEYGSTLDVPASDIESMDILKDAASTAIYGTKGANGVILITTKRGKAGKTSVTFNGYLSFNSATAIVKPMYGDKEVQRLIDKKNYEDAAANNWSFSNSATAADVLTFQLEDGTETLDIYKNKSYTDWLDMILENSVSQNYEVAVQGGNEKTNFNVSLAAMDDKGIMKGDEFNRYTGRVNIDHQINKIVKIGASVSYAYKSNDKRAGGVFNQAQKMTTITHAYLKDGSINATPNPWYAAHCSPLLNEDGAFQRNIESSRFFGSAYLQLNPIKGMMLKSQFTADRSTSRDGQYQDYHSQVRYQSPTTTYISSDRNTATKYVWQNTATYNKEIAKHDFTVLLGHEMSQYVQETSTISGDAGAESYKKSSFYDVSKIISPFAATSYTKTSMVSFFGRANYSYDGKYLLQASIRADGSSVLAEGHKWGYFPSVSAGWRISEESFMQGTKSWLDNLKFRVSWGLSGNSAISAYQTLATISSIVPNSTEKAPMTMANPELTWEKTSALDFGLDFSFINGRVYGSIDYYNSHTYDLLYYKTAPASTVFTSTIDNVGKTKGHGIEISLGVVPVKTKDFTWDVTASATFARDEVEELADGIEQFVDGVNILKVGEPVSAYYTYDMDGCWGIGEFDKYLQAHPNFEKPQDDYGDPGTPKVIDTNGDNKIDDSDKVIYNRSPKSILGLSTTLTYKDFSLSIQTMARLGGYLSYSGYGLYLYDNANWGDLDYWTAENQDADIPSPGCAGATPTFYKSSIQIQKADYFKIKDITLSYNLPKNILKSVFISNARVYFSLKNYFTFSHFDNYDPERGGAVNFPLMKQAVVGLNVTF